MLTQAEEDLLQRAMTPSTPGPPECDLAFAPESDTSGRTVSPARLDLAFPYVASKHLVDEHTTVNWGPRAVEHQTDHERIDTCDDENEIWVLPADSSCARPMDRSSRGPRLHIVTPGSALHAVHNKPIEVSRVSPQKSMKDTFVNVTSVPSGLSTASSSSTPLIASQQRSYTSKPASTYKSQRSAEDPSSSATSSGLASSRSRFARWPFRGRTKERARFPGLPARSQSPTPFKIPERLSRLPSFFIRERLYTAQHMQQRDRFLICMTCLLGAVFLSIGIFAAIRPHLVCRSRFLGKAVNTVLPSLLVEAPYTLVVVGIGVCGWGRQVIKGRYTPFLYLLLVVLGQVGIGALIGNLDWTLLVCEGS